MVVMLLRESRLEVVLVRRLVTSSLLSRSSITTIDYHPKHSVRPPRVTNTSRKSTTSGRPVRLLEPMDHPWVAFAR
jgi:hypothetical protein